MTPFKRRGRPPGTKGRGGRATRPSLSATEGNGSDFDFASNHSEVRQDPEDDEELPVMQIDQSLPTSESEPELMVGSPDPECSLSNPSGLVAKRKSGQRTGSSSLTPLPFWLQSDLEIPRLELPKSSKDLLLPAYQVLPACAIYEVLSKFSSEVCTHVQLLCASSSLFLLPIYVLPNRFDCLHSASRTLSRLFSRTN